MLEKFQTFLINVVVIEGRHYFWPNSDSMVMVKVHDQKKYTAVKVSTDCPYYNEHFVFEFSTTVENIIDMNITMTVIKPGSVLRKRKILGYVSFDVGTVWYQQDHQFYHKWAVLSAPREEFTSGNRGYLKIDVSVLTKGEIPKIPRVFNTEEIEGNLLLPNGRSTDRQRITFIIDIYKGMDFIKKHPLQDNLIKKTEIPSSLSIGVSFSETAMKTSVRKNTSKPSWNERLILPELFPPLCQRFKVELYHGEGSKKATRYLNMRDIANDKEEGFLPTFGPTFLHFYSSNHLEGYLGKLLIALETKWLGSAVDHEPSPAIQETPSIDEEKLLKYETVTLFAVIFDATSINNKYSDKPISFRIACGPCQRELDENGDKFSSALTVPTKPAYTNKNYCFLPIEGSKPCLYLTLTLPDTRKRMYNSNLLTRILREFKNRLDIIEGIFSEQDYKTASSETEALLLDTLDHISSAANKYIDIVSSYSFAHDTILDQQRKKMCLKEMEEIIFMLKSVPVHVNKKKIFQKLEKIYTKLESLIDNVEAWPLVYLWMIYGNKRVAYYIIKPENIVHSAVQEEKGINCGILQTVYFQTDEFQNVPKSISMVCQMNVILWMGLARHWNSCLESLPLGFTLFLKSVPRVLLADEKHEFQCRIYIFQGRFSPGSDKSGLCDPYVQVIVGGQYRQTEILRKTLNPIWDQSLYFNNIVLYGSKEFILINPPVISVEIYDKDNFRKAEAVGKCFISPVIKTVDEIYGPPKFPPKLTSYTVHNRMNVKAEILAAAELLELTQDDVIDDDKIIRKIPQDIKPNLINYRIDVVFWGIREKRASQMKNFSKPKISIECANISLQSDIIPNAKKNSNFPNPIRTFEVILPDQKRYAPALSIKMFDCRNFGTMVLAGAHTIPMEKFFYTPLSAKARERKILEEKCENVYRLSSSVSTFLQTFEETSENKIKSKEKRKRKARGFFMCKKEKNEKLSSFFEEEEPTENEDFNWWTKFYASLEAISQEDKSLPRNKHKLKIYRNELESQPEFEGFTDLLQVFPLYKGKRTGDESVDEENTIGLYKGSLKIYPWPPTTDYVTASGLPLEKGAFQDFPSNNPVRFVLRVYCIRGVGLRPKDINGKSDPYLYLRLGSQVIDDKDNRIMGQVNPIFGRCFELDGMFPQDHTLIVAVYDWDATSANDLIGETRIDVENRFYTRHRAHCGLAEDYISTGYCQWRDQQKPTTILENLCRRYNIPEPAYAATSVNVASKDFQPTNFVASDNIDYDRQVLALAALRRWHEIPVAGCVLVPEHVETRSLYNPSKPGIEQGKLQLWIDILPVTDLPTPRAVNIVPRKPVAYELRVVIWNAENMKMDEDDFFTGEKKSDIYVKGWLTSPENSQYTDVHYRSLSGEANFNWRFIFRFEYVSNENRIVLKEKSMFGQTENKIPCRFNLQVWDNDTFTKDDFLGALTLEVSRLQRGAKTAKSCNLAILQPTTPILNLFKTKRTRGWWPLKNVDLKKQQDVFAGAVELEFELLTQEDALKFPAGLGREEPQGLPKPKRPDASFSWFWNPLKATKYVLKANKWKFIKLLLFLILILFVVAGFYDLPEYSVKKFLGIK